MAYFQHAKATISSNVVNVTAKHTYASDETLYAHRSRVYLHSFFHVNRTPELTSHGFGYTTLEGYLPTYDG